MRLKGFTLLILVNIAAAFPAKLLRVPKIYNALITSKEKILPSEAYPATTGPLFQPIGLPGDPLLINPGLIFGKPQEFLSVEPGTDVKAPEEGPRRKNQPPAPVTFYPRYSLYYAHQPYLTLQQRLLYPAIEVPNPGQPLVNQHPVPRELEVAERKDLSLQNNKMSLAQNLFPAQSGVMEYVKNNRPADSRIPDIPPPPPPVRFKGPIDDV